jgi:protein gp37
VGDTTGIAWTEKTWNPWQGCRKVSAGCKHCYMFAEKARYGQDPATVVRSKPPTFNAPRKWTDPALVFTCSWSDFFIEEADAWRADAWEIIRATPHLTYQILTKRPERLAACLPPDWGEGYPNVCLGVSIERQEEAYPRALWLLETPARIRFVSAEPLLGALDLTNIEVVKPQPPHGPGVWLDALRGHVKGPDDLLGARIDWVIVGGESGSGARPCDVAWIRSLVAQCRAAGTKVFVKQLGAVAATAIAPTGRFRTHPETGTRQVQMQVTTLPLRDRKGGDPAEWPEDLRVREMPEVRHE